MEKELFPLHPAQCDIYFDQLVNIESPHYNIGGYIKLKGPLDVEKLKEVARSMPEAFDSFKMRFDLTERERGFYFDEAYCRFEITEIDFSGYPDPVQTAEQWIQKQFNTTFSLTKNALPLEQFLLKLNNNEHWLFNRYHHLITDGYGFSVLAHYIASKYISLVENNKIEFLHPSYREEAIKASSYYASVSYQAEKKYWLDKIDSLPSRLFSRKYTSTLAMKNESGKHSTFLDPEQEELLKTLQVRSGCSLQQLTIAALIIYLGKTTNHSEFVFGVPIHRRRNRQQRTIFGTFSGILPFKGRYTRETKLIDLLKDIRSSQKQDYRHQNYLASDLSRELKHNSIENQLFEIIINYEALNFQLDFGKDLSATIVHPTSNAEAFPLQVCWREFGDQQPLELRIDFQQLFFSHAEIELFSQRILFIVWQFLENLDNNLTGINILPPAELQQVHTTFNATAVVYPKDKTVIDLFEEQVRRAPENIAIDFEHYTLSYRALNARANQVAHFLRNKGVSEGTLVPICLEKGIDMITGILGIVKAGGVYVPVDPAYPEERVTYMVNDTSPCIIVSSSSSKSKLPDTIQLVQLDTDWDDIARESEENLAMRINPEQLIYVIYTSGSTGTPKGAGVFHRSVVNLLQWYIREFSISPADCNMIISSPGFDLTQKNIFGTLLAGGKIIMPRMPYYDVDRIRTCMQEKSVTIINCAPSAFYPLVEDTRFFNKLRSLRLTILGGEPVRLNYLSHWIAETNYGCEIVNSYGPTECTDIASFYRLPDPRKHTHDSMPIGRPNDNVRLFIVNEFCELQPIGVSGEICITGESVGAGYLNDDELTKEKFLKNPFGDGMLYKTGDLGCWLPDGNIEYRGRFDDQVKIRGYRIELAEIENILQQNENVHRAVVLTTPDSKGHNQLTGYIVPKEDFNKEAILLYLKTKLPDYMIPSAFVELESIPLTPNGKIDKANFPTPTFYAGADYVAPRNEIEKELVKIWSAVLNIDPSKIGVNDNFFSLGGHSLLGVNLMAQISKVFSVELQITILFECPEIGLLATHLSEDIVMEREEPIIIPVNSGYGKSSIFCVPGAGGNVLSFHSLGKLMGKEQSFYAFQAPGLNGRSLPLKTVEEMATLYITEMQKIDPDGPYTVGGYSFGASVAYEMALQLVRKGFCIAKLIIFDAYEPTRIIGHVAMPGITAENDDENLCRMAESFANLYEKELRLSATLIKNKPREEQLQMIHEVLNGIGIDVTVDQMKGFIDVCFANISCVYIPQNDIPLNAPVILFKPEERVKEENSWGLGRPMEKDSMGWEGTTTEKVMVYNVSGNHWTFLNEPHVQEIAMHLTKALKLNDHDNGIRNLYEGKTIRITGCL